MTSVRCARSSTSASLGRHGLPSGPRTHGRLLVPAVGRLGPPERAAARVVDRPAQRLVVRDRRCSSRTSTARCDGRLDRGGRRRTRWRRRGARARARSRASCSAPASWSHARRTPAGSATQNAKWCSRGPRARRQRDVMDRRLAQQPGAGELLVGRRRWRCTPSSGTRGRSRTGRRPPSRGVCRLTWSNRRIGAPRCRSKRWCWVADALHRREELQRVAERVRSPQRPADRRRPGASTHRVCQPALVEAAGQGVEVVLAAHPEPDPRRGMRTGA